MREIVVYPDPVLLKKAEPVEVFDEELTRFVAEMHQIMIAAQGVGLAAPQVGVSKQICIIDTTIGEDPDQLYVLINPEFLETSGAQKGEEGCLSFPDLITVVERPTYVKLACRNLAGDRVEVEAHDFLARAFCHEIDHLNGIVFLERMSAMKRSMLKKKIQKRQKAGTWTR
jgi:peptide deformylase